LNRYAHQDSIGRGVQDVLDDADRGELDVSEVPDEAGGDESDGELKHLREERRESESPEEPGLLPAPARKPLHNKPVWLILPLTLKP